MLRMLSPTPRRRSMSLVTFTHRLYGAVFGALPNGCTDTPTPGLAGTDTFLRGHLRLLPRYAWLIRFGPGTRDPKGSRLTLRHGPGPVPFPRAADSGQDR